MVRNNSYVDKYPYKLDRCDQVLMIKAKMIHHINCKKSLNLFLTISAYYLNIFSHKNPEKLLYSFNTKDFDGLPEIQKNSDECLEFFS